MVGSDRKFTKLIQELSHMNPLSLMAQVALLRPYNSDECQRHFCWSLTCFQYKCKILVKFLFRVLIFIGLLGLCSFYCFLLLLFFLTCNIAFKSTCIYYEVSYDCA